MQESKTELYVIVDLLAEEPGPIFQAPNSKVALRQFLQVIKNSVCPNDYQLVKVGYMYKSLELVNEYTVIETPSLPSIPETPEKAKNDFIEAVIKAEQKTMEV